MKKTRIENLFLWSHYQPEKQLDFNGFLWVQPSGNLLIDPMPLSEQERGELKELGGARWVLLTNFDHLRDAVSLCREFGAELWAPEAERERFGIDAEAVNGWYRAGQPSSLPAELGPNLAVHSIRGGKSPVETALYIEPIRALCFGDVVRSHEVGNLRLLPDPKLTDRAKVIASLRPLASLPIDALLLGDGDCFFYRAQDAFHEFLATLD